jgi:hypothetical protein
MTSKPHIKKAADPLFNIKMMSDTPFLGYYMQKLALPKEYISPLYGDQSGTVSPYQIASPLSQRETAKLSRIMKDHREEFHHLAVARIQ